MTQAEEANLKAENIKYQERLEKAVTVFKQQKAEIENLNKRIADLTEKASHADESDAKFFEQVDEITKLNQDIKERDCVIKEQDDTISAQDKEIAILNQDLEGKCNAVENMTAEIKEKNDIIAKQEGAMAELESTIQELKREIKFIKDQKKAYMAKITAIICEYADAGEKN